MPNCLPKYVESNDGKTFFLKLAVEDKPVRINISKEELEILLEEAQMLMHIMRERTTEYDIDDGE